MTCIHLACTRVSAVGVLRLLLQQPRVDATARLSEDAVSAGDVTGRGAGVGGAGGVLKSGPRPSLVGKR